MKVPDELSDEDRQNFDDVVLEEFSINICLRRIYNSMKALHGIRMAAMTRNFGSIDFLADIMHFHIIDMIPVSKICA